MVGLFMILVLMGFGVIILYNKFDKARIIISNIILVSSLVILMVSYLYNTSIRDKNSYTKRVPATVKIYSKSNSNTGLVFVGDKEHQGVLRDRDVYNNYDVGQRIDVIKVIYIMNDTGDIRKVEFEYN